MLKSDRWARITILGGGREVGRAAYLVESTDGNVLLDCGVDVSTGNTPYLELLNVEDLSAVVLSHAHLDHSGMLPYLMRMGYDNPIYMTRPTFDITSLLLEDMLKIAYNEDKDLPFSKGDVKRMKKNTYILEYYEDCEIDPDITLNLFSAGHILGSAMAYLKFSKFSVLYTGDFNYDSTRLLDPADSNIPDVNTVLIEGTYGSKDDKRPSRKKLEQMLTQDILKTLKNGGKVIIPAFAVGRSQEMLLFLKDIFTSLNLEYEIYVDGMIWEASKIYSKYSKYLKDSVWKREGNPFLSKDFIRVRGKKREDCVNIDYPSVIVTTSGMLTGGPILHYLEHLGGDARNSLYLVGYQAEGTLGRKILDGKREIEINGKKIELNLEVKWFHFSSHSDRNALIRFVRDVMNKTDEFVIVHGEERKVLEFAEYIEKRKSVKTPKNVESVRII